MGMYDILGDGHQVKTFNIPVFYYSENNILGSRMLGYMGGNLRFFGKDDTLPLHTWHYRYPGSFLIVDILDINFPEYHFIKEKKYFDTYEHVDLIPDEIFSNSIKSYDYYGDEIIGISSKEDLKNYQNNIILYEEERLAEYKKFQPFSNAFFTFLHENKDSFDETDKEYTRIKSEYNLAFKKLEEKEKELRDKYLNTYKSKHNRIDILSETGGYLQCLRHYLDMKDIDENKMQTLLKEGKDYMSENSVTFEEWAEWNNPTEEERAAALSVYNQFLSCK